MWSGGEGRGEKGRGGERRGGVKMLHTYIHMYIRTYICTYIHTYIHTDPLTKWVVEELSLLKSFKQPMDQPISVISKQTFLLLILANWSASVNSAEL